MIGSCAIAVLEVSLKELDELLATGKLSRVAQLQGEKTSRDMHAMLAEYRARPPCDCGDNHVNFETS